MPFPFKSLLARLGRIDKVFLAVLAASFVGNFIARGSIWQLLLTFLAFVLGVIVAFKWMLKGVKKIIWRLRYRLLIAYLFIAFVPILLIVVMAGLGAYILTGQLAAYLVTTELDRMYADLIAPARGLALTPADSRIVHAQWLAPAFWDRYPGLEIVIRDRGVWRYPENSELDPAPAAWHDIGGLVRRDGKLYVWAHTVHDSTEVTMAVPVTERLLGRLAPNLGKLSLRRTEMGVRPEELPDGGGPRTAVPAPLWFFDLEVPYPAVLKVAVWESPHAFQNDALFLVTRYSAVLNTIIGRQAEWKPGETSSSLIYLAFKVVGIVLALVVLASIFLGVRLTRTITLAVHNLYQGTERIRVADFSHRIEVQGDDQLAELTRSFNHMTGDLERLVEVAKEKERLQSEIEIAREVQNQLFPKCLPVSKTLEVAATCLPARLVSGDYYDYMNLEDPSLALAIGDVAGKGISAALLMATVQSTMRTQLRAGQLVMAAGNGGQQPVPSTALLVSRLNQQLFAFTPPEKFATFYFALYDDQTGMLTYTNAGHLPPILVREGAATRLDVTGTVVGAFSFAQYGESSVRLLPGDLLVCFTDGVTEPENEFGEMFGEDRLTELVVKHASQDSDSIIGAVMDSVRQWTGSPELQDDMTLLLARRVG